MNSSNVSAAAGEREENASQALGGGGGQVPDPPKAAFPTRGLFRGTGPSRDARRPVTGAGTPEWRGPKGLRAAVVGAHLAGGAWVRRRSPFVRRVAAGSARTAAVT